MKTVNTTRKPRLAAALAVTAAAALALTACGSGFSSGSSASPEAGTTETASNTPLKVLIGSSGDAETTAVKTAVADWSKESGIDASVNVASDLAQQLSQGFASGNPADVFYVSTDQLAGYAANGSLEPYGDSLANKDDFFPALREAFTVEDKLYCAPKDFSTLGLIINNKLWTDAGLTDEDIPANWDELADVAGKLTKGKTVGLAFSPEFQRVGAFFAQAGGGLVGEDGQASVNSEANVEALNYVKGLMNDGVAKYSSELGAGWGGEAFGKGLAAMVIEGNWIAGAMKNDFPNVDYRVAELPEGPGGKGTLQYTNCWGIAADSKNKVGARQLIEKLTSAEDQMAFAKAFGVMPSIQPVADQWKEEYPEMAPFIEGAEYARNVPAQKGASDVITELNAKLETLKTSDPKAILDSVQKDMEAVLADAK